MTRRVWRTRCPGTAPRAPRQYRPVAKDASDTLLAVLVLLAFFFLAWLC